MAHAHRAMSKILITMKSVHYTRPNSKTEINLSDQVAFLHHAHEAFRIAQDWFGVEDRVRLFPFKMSLAHALQASVNPNSNDQNDTSFADAMELLDDCLAVAQEIFGSMSFKVAQVHRLRSATFLSKKMFDLL